MTVTDILLYLAIYTLGLVIGWTARTYLTRAQQGIREP